MNDTTNANATTQRRGRGRPRRTTAPLIIEEETEVEVIVNNPPEPPTPPIVEPIEEIIETDFAVEQDTNIEHTETEMANQPINIIIAENEAEEDNRVIETITEEVIDTDNEEELQEEIIDDDPEPELDTQEKCPCCLEEEWGNTFTRCGHPLCVDCYTNLLRVPSYFGRRQDGCPICRTIMTEPPIKALTDAEKLEDYERMKRAFEEMERERNTQGNRQDRFNRQHYQQRVNELSTTNLNQSRRIRQLEAENAQLRTQLGGGVAVAVAQAPVAQGVARPNRRVRDANDPTRPAGRNDPINLQPNQVLGDLEFARRPRARCGCEGCNRFTRRVCDGCRNVRVCQEHMRCPNCNA